MSASFMIVGCDGTTDEEQASDSEHEASDSDHESEGHGTHGEETEGEHTEGEDSDCAAETRDDDFAIGLSKSGEMVNATFVSADPAPPIKGNNSWVMDFTDMDGQPLEDLGIVVIPMMPDHGHGTPVEAVVTPLETPGQYEITPVNLFMTGYWEVNMELTLSGGEQDALMFGFCVE